MSIHVKTALILLITLVIGVVIGGLGTHFFLRPQPPVEHEDMFFLRMHERIIQPTDEQRDTVRVILEEHMQQFHALAMQNRARMSVLLDSLYADLESVLSPEQLERIREQRNHFGKRLQRGPMGGRGNFPGGGFRERDFRPGPPFGRPPMMDPDRE